MSRAERLLRLMETLRRHRYPAKGSDLAENLSVSLRTLYRDIAALQAQGARIDGSPGVGYLLRPGFVLPPLMLSIEETEALILGSRWVSRHADSELRQAALNLLAKIEAVVPAELRQEMASSGMLVGPGENRLARDADLAGIRKAIRTQSKLLLRYVDLAEEETTRTVWPFALAFFDRALILAAWCELRQDFRHFRIDRVRVFDTLEERYPRNRRSLLEEWRAQRAKEPAGRVGRSRTTDRN
jgi:predicted DNA-binding transcriptional regulator YafY